MGCCAVTIIRGAHRAARAVLGLDQAPAAEIERRRVICRACPRAVPSRIIPGNFSWCAECLCALKLKTTLAKESCPIGKWASCPPEPKGS